MGIYLKIKNFAEDSLFFVPDKIYLRFQYLCRMKRPLHLRNPKKMTEKLQWLKLYDRNPLYTELTDKYAVRKYVEEKIGGQYLIPMLGVWDSADNIDFDTLPDEFVLKCTHDSGSIIVCRDKSKLDIPSVRKKISRSLKRNYYWHAREWPYKNISPRVIAQKYIPVRDVSFYCFDGVPRLLIMTCYKVDNFSKKIASEHYFDENYNPISMQEGRPQYDAVPECPVCFEEMKQIARKLSENLPYARVDLYEAGGKPYFGEITMFNAAGYCHYEPAEWDEKLGAMLKLPRGGKT